MPCTKFPQNIALFPCKIGVDLPENNCVCVRKGYRQREREEEIKKEESRSFAIKHRELYSA